MLNVDRLKQMFDMTTCLSHPSQDTLQDNLNKLKRLAAERTRNLERTKRLHAYMRESEDFENWINEQMVHACSEEYGQDYEHLQVEGLERIEM